MIDEYFGALFEPDVVLAAKETLPALLADRRTWQLSDGELNAAVNAASPVLKRWSEATSHFLALSAKGMLVHLASQTGLEPEAIAANAASRTTPIAVVLSMLVLPVVMLRQASNRFEASKNAILG